jgi:hypothetical protein
MCSVLFPLDVSMVPSSALTISADSEHLLCGGFSLCETIHFGRLEFITDCFGGLSLSRRGAVRMPPSLDQPIGGHRPRCGP